MATTRKAFAISCCAAAAIAACGASPAAPPSTSSAPASTSAARPTATPAASPAAAAAHAPPSATALFEAMKSDLAGCYDAGKRSTPAMGDGRVTFHAAVDRGGRASCVVTSDDTGLTQAVEDCMSERVSRESYARYAVGGDWTFEIPVQVRSGVVALRTPPAGAVEIESIETHGIDDASRIIATLLPTLDACVDGLGKHSGVTVVHLGARVARDGHVTCAIATSKETLPTSVRDCAARVLLDARFSSVRADNAYVSIPVRVH